MNMTAPSYSQTNLRFEGVTPYYLYKQHKRQQFVLGVEPDSREVKRLDASQGGEKSKDWPYLSAKWILA